MLEAGIPARRRTKFLPRLEAGADLVIGRALFRILQYIMGLANFLEAGLGAGGLVYVGVKLAGRSCDRPA